MGGTGTTPNEGLFVLKRFMKFAETNPDIITVTKYGDCFVYFLLKCDEVVYVGQTKNGIARPLSHRDKDFDEIKILYCDPIELDFVEDAFIQKYKPVYNKQSNLSVRWSLLKVRNHIRQETHIKNCTIPRLKKIIRALNIQIEKDYYNGKETISAQECKHIVSFVQNGGT